MRTERWLQLEKKVDGNIALHFGTKQHEGLGTDINMNDSMNWRQVYQSRIPAKRQGNVAVG